MDYKRVLTIVSISFISAISAVGVYKYLEDGPTTVTIKENTTPVHFTSYGKNFDLSTQPIDFTVAALLTTPAVVHIKTTYQVKVNQYLNHPFYEYLKDFFNSPYENQPSRDQYAFGSGVIIKSNGYIVTNNHVVENGDNIEVTLSNNKTYKAEIIGTDPSTDIAVIKIDMKDLPTIPYTNSDDVKVGQWVLAVGNPFNFSSTVTAGIVSAKSRNIDILKDGMRVESFIQTDAAVNKGNSGGALVNTEGKLIGINTAIVSPNGAFAGYSFAIPSNIVEKTVNDLISFGIVQRGLLGISIINMNSEIATKMDVDIAQGVFIESVLPDGAASDAGLKNGDIITTIDGKKIKNVSELQEEISKHRPGDKVSIIILRNGKHKTVSATLKNKNNTTSIIKKSDITVSQILGADFRVLTPSEKKKLGISKGLVITKLRDGMLKRAEVKQGFIITKIDNKPIDSLKDLNNALKYKKGNTTLQGIYPGTLGNYYYAFKYETK